MFLRQKLYLVALAAIGLSACSGELGDAPAPGGGTSEPPPDDLVGSELDSGSTPLKRLAKREYEATVRDLLGSKLPEFDLPEDGREHGFDTVGTVLQISDIHLLAYQKMAEALIEELFAADPAGIKKAWCDYNAGNAGAACAETIVKDFATRMWRRPLDKWGTLGNGLGNYLDLLSGTGPLAEEPLEARLQAALTGILMSPRFIYRFEFVDPNGRLDSYSVASRLSFFLWRSAPDAELLASNLMDARALEAQLKRMQGSAQSPHPKFQRFLTRFPELWLGLEVLPGVDRDKTMFPGFGDDLAWDMRDETLALFGRFAVGAERALPISDILTTTSSTVTPGLANHYCSVDGNTDDCRIQAATGAVDLKNAASPRKGLLTQAAIMTVTGAETKTAPVRRGLWVMERMICDAPPPPPPDATAQIEKTQMDKRMISQRERLAEHRANPTCAACHVVMDPIGLGFESYDSIGRYRTKDESGVAIDPAGALPDGRSFNGPTELAELLAKDPRFQSCVVRHLVMDATGRSVSGPADDELVDGLVMRAGGAKMSLPDAVRSVILSEAFRRRKPLD